LGFLEGEAIRLVPEWLSLSVLGSVRPISPVTVSYQNLPLLYFFDEKTSDTARKVPVRDMSNLSNLSTPLQEKDASKSGKSTISKVNRFLLVTTLFASSQVMGLNNGFSRRQLEKGPIATHQQEDAIAVMIAGQCQRFVYRDQEGPLFDFTGHSIRPIVDVYIALHCGEKVHADGHLSTPPYMENPDIDDIKQWYKSKGADNVFVRIMDDEHIEAKQKVVEDFVFHLHNAGTLMKTIDDIYKQDKPRWGIELRKFYMKNLVYRMTKQQGPDNTHYDWYVHWREDNIFMTPLDIYGAVHVQQGMGEPGSSQKNAKVWVDKPCRFGSYSDKIYIGNEQGMRLLFEESFAEYMILMKEYAFSTSVRSLVFHRGIRAAITVYQPEQFVNDRLLLADVREIDMKRIDVRYKGEQRCIPRLYYSCMPNETLSMARKHGIEECV